MALRQESKSVLICFFVVGSVVGKEKFIFN
jgi:hypothetical protein